MQKQFVFFGSPRLAQIVLDTVLHAGLVPDLVVCSPDRPVGRKHTITPPPVKLLAQYHNIPILQPEKPSVSDFLKQSRGASYAIVAAYARIIPKEILNLFPSGVLGIHPSLLPLYRGPSPIQAALLDGLPSTGVSLYKMDEKMDHGPILAQISIPMGEDDTYQTLEEKLALAGAKRAIQIIPPWLDGSLKPITQDHTKATYTKKFATQDGFVDLEKDSAQTIAQKIKALSFDPGVFAFINGKRIKLREVKKIGDDWIITKIIPEGKKERKVKIILKK